MDKQVVDAAMSYLIMLEKFFLIRCWPTEVILIVLQKGTGLTHFLFCKLCRAAKNYRGGKQFNGKRGRNPDAEKNSSKAQKVEAAA